MTTTSAGSQSTDVRTDRMLAMRAVRQRGEMGGQAMSIDVEYEGGRAAGPARIPAAGGMTVDAEIPPGAIDDNILVAVLPVIRWNDGLSFDLPVFASGNNSLVTYGITARREALDGPDGPVPAYRVQIDGGDVPLLVHVSRPRPHRLLRLEPVGSPMVVVRQGPVD